MIKRHLNIVVIILSIICFNNLELFSQSYKIVGTGQNKCYNNSEEIAFPQKGEAFFGQDAQNQSLTASYTDNGDGTITDNITGLMWQKSPDFNEDGIINYNDKKTFQEAIEDASAFNLGGYTDWRLPSIKELYSLFMAFGTDPSGPNSTDIIPFIDTTYFPFGFGDELNGERIIDAQYATSSIYVGKVFGSQTAMFGVNFADGRIKGYPVGADPQGNTKKYYIKYVRGNTYGNNDFEDIGAGKIIDNATGLMWAKDDSGEGFNWEQALEWVQTKNSETYLGYSDWRLPNVKELQSIVDYSRSPQTTNSPAINELFNCSKIKDEGENDNYPFYWTSTTHVSAGGNSRGGAAMYICFGEALGFMEMPPNSGNINLLDVHGAGAQRSDFKSGNPADYPEGHGPQGDVVRIYNFVRLVRDAVTSKVIDGINSSEIKVSPNSDYTSLLINIGEQSLDEVSVCNLFGSKIITKTEFEKQLFSLDISKLSSGVYFILFVNNSDMISKQLIIKR